MERKILLRCSNGEYIPVNKNDKLLWEACIQYNTKIKNGDILDDGECPIKTNLLYYYPKSNKLKLFRKWCDIQNDLLREARRNQKK